MDLPVPSDVPMPHIGQLVLIVGMSALALLSIGYAIVESRRRGDLLLIFLVIGAGLAIPYEALGDSLVHVYYTEHGQITWIHTFGRDIPAFIGILYFWYLPFGAYALLRRASKGVTTRQFWAAWLATLSFCIGFEILVTETAGPTWIYYGPQAFVVGDVPFFTPFTYVSFCLGIAAGVAGLERVLPKRQQWLLIPAVPMLMFATQGMTSLPLAVSLHSGTTNHFYLALGALGSGAFAVVLAWIVSLAVRKPWARTNETAAAPQVAGIAMGSV
ncbi:hypothetical protein [Nocardia miyunensis]|uniref:hypothetical protein n=1 Tax=Nocardia miyunensis TaxID=282684 RepID=UPI000A6ACA0B|nr:hypothetical protein [Nocardia miyunensis]